MKLDKLTVSTRLNVLVAVLTIVLILLGSIGFFGMRSANQSIKSIYENRTIPISQLGEINYLMQRNRVLILDMAADTSPQNLSKRAKEVHDNLDKIKENWTAYMATSLTPSEAVQARETEQARTTYFDEGIIPTLQALENSQHESAMGLYKGKVSALAPAVRDTMNKLVQLQLDVAKNEFQTNDKLYSTSSMWLFISIGAGAAFAILFGMAVTRSITRQLGAEPIVAAEQAALVAAGNLSHAIELKHGDTSSVMAQFKTMQDSLVKLVSHVRQGSESVSTASAEIAQGNNDLSSRTENQASALEQTAASMEELSSTVKQNADNAHQANQLAMNASTVAVQGGEVVAQVVNTMKGINEASRKISDIIGVIDGIAFQTNILALNAAVEAARAGEQGRGFAVVASEVRSLAGRSAEAAKEIKTLINVSVERVEQGTILVDQAGTTMNEVVTSIKRVTDIMGEISAASNEQSLGVSQVGEAVTQMDQVTQQNAALVEEMAAAASSLKSQAQDLVQTVAVFKLSGNDSYAVDAPRPAPVRAAASVTKKLDRRTLATPSKSVTKPVPSIPAKKLAIASASPAQGGNDEWETF